MRLKLHPSTADFYYSVSLVKHVKLDESVLIDCMAFLGIIFFGRFSVHCDALYRAIFFKKIMSIEIVRCFILFLGKVRLGDFLIHFFPGRSL